MTENDRLYTRKGAPPGSTCEEASPRSHLTYVPCGRPAKFIVKTKDPKPYNMCPSCAIHNVRNRGAKYEMVEVKE